jgi:hypothetical protein
MERLFSPCTRLHDTLESQGGLERLRRRHPEPLQELNLNVSTEELLSAERAFTYADLNALVRNKNTLAWFTPHAAVVREHGRAMRYWRQLNEEESRSFSFRADGKDLIAFARSTEHLLEICDIIFRLLAVSVVHSVILRHWRSLDVFINAPTFAYLMEHCQSLKVLSLMRLEMGEDIVRVLGAYSRPDLEIILDRCEVTSAGASTLIEVLGRNQGPTKLDLCEIDNSVIANGLRGNSRLKSLKSRFSGVLEIDNPELLAIADAFRENKGLVDLDLSYSRSLNDETWCAICDSLKAHPTLEVLNLGVAFPDTAPAPAVLNSRIQALVDMMKVNMSIHTIHLHDRLSHHELFRGSVIPYLKTNRFRPRVRAIQRIRPIQYRAKVLGRALLSARTDANSFWMLLSGNAEIAFPSTTATIAAAANLPTPATAAATTTAVTGSLPTATVTAAATTIADNSSTASASDTFVPTSAANVAAPSAGQKRKVRP